MNMIHKAQILRTSYERTSGGSGGVQESEATVASNVPCFIQNMKIDERERWMKKEIDVDVKVYFETEPNLEEGDFLICTENLVGTSYVGFRFKFQAIDDATAGHGCFWKAIMKRETNIRQPNTA